MLKSIAPHLSGCRPLANPPQTLLPLAALIGALSCQVAFAQEAPPPPEAAASAAQQSEAPAEKADKTQLPEVIVTAEKRGTSLQKTPISVTAITGATIQEKGLSNAKDLMREIPGIATKSGGAGQTEYAIRGLSSTGGSSATVGFYLDEVPMSPPAGATGGFSPVDPDLYDLARIEVLRGPQGTLYGSSSMGGTIKLIPNAPVLNQFSGSAQLSGSSTAGGGFNYTANAALNVPLASDVAAMRLVVTKKHSSGWIDRIYSRALPLPNEDGSRGDVTAVPADGEKRNINDEDTTSARVSILLKPTSRLTITPSVMVQRVKKGAPDAFDEFPGTQTRYQVFNTPEPYSDRFANAAVKVNYDFEGASLTSVTSHTRRKKSQTEDGTEGVLRTMEMPAYLLEDGGLGLVTTKESDKTRQLSQELRLASTGDGPLRWLVGAYYSRHTTDLDMATAGPDVEAVLGDTIYSAIEQTRITQKAVFANVSYDLTKDLRLTGGLRYFTSKVASQGSSAGIFGEGAANEPESATAKGTTPMVSLNYNISPDSMVYATAAKGFRDGGAQPVVPTNVCGDDLAALGRDRSPGQYAPDTVWSYELGSKNRFLNRSLSLNAAVYTQKWSKVQSVVTLPTCGYQYFDNTGSATATGFEVEAGWKLSSGLTLEQSVGYTRARYTSTDASTDTRSGDPLPGVPKWSASTSIRYETPINDKLSFLGRIGVTYTAGSTYKRANIVELPSYTFANMRLGVVGDEWSAAFFIDNITNKHPATYVAGSLGADYAALNRLGTIRPRTIGLEVSYNF